MDVAGGGGRYHARAMKHEQGVQACIDVCSSFVRSYARFVFISNQWRCQGLEQRNR